MDPMALFRTLLLLALAPLSAWGCASRRADELALAGNLAGALEAYALEDTYDAHLKMGMLHQTQGDHHEAIAEYSLAVPRNAEADYRVYQFRAESYLATGELAKARADLEEALRRSPRVAQIHFLLGNVLYRQNELAPADAAYSRAIEEAGDQAELKARALKNRALVHFRTEAFEAAAADYEAALQLARPPDREDRLHLGLLLYATGRESEARDAWSGLSAADRERLRSTLDENLGEGF
ncbi:MAG: tetratricopeptide repeat protein [Planctomycetes bacterium]|nr:tetratricopeptide repeat protein [Planctomycetota bacterium]